MWLFRCINSNFQNRRTLKVIWTKNCKKIHIFLNVFTWKLSVIDTKYIIKIKIGLTMNRVDRWSEILKDLKRSFRWNHQNMNYILSVKCYDKKNCSNFSRLLRCRKAQTIKDLVALFPKVQVSKLSKI